MLSMPIFQLIHYSFAKILLLGKMGQSVQGISSSIKIQFKKSKCKSHTVQVVEQQLNVHLDWRNHRSHGIWPPFLKGSKTCSCHIHSVPICEQVITCTNDLHELVPYFKVGIIHANSQGPVALIAICSFTLDKILSFNHQELENRGIEQMNIYESFCCR